MTEIASGQGARKTRNSPPQVRRTGLTIERVYTTEGIHPYDQVTWERRDVVQTNWKTGETIFEQKAVEFPDFWSVNASTIVTTKYFRGALGSDVRERSLKQLIDRVVLTYTKAGRDNGYFLAEGDAEIFEHELTHMLLHQVFSFNSPVWFNVGTSAPQQVSACFILAVDDGNAYLAAGLAGLGVLWLLDYMVKDHVARGELVRLFDDWQIAPMPLTLAYSPNRHVSARLRVFIDWVVGLMAEHAPVLPTAHHSTHA